MLKRFSMPLLLVIGFRGVNAMEYAAAGMDIFEAITALNLPRIRQLIVEDATVVNQQAGSHYNNTPLHLAIMMRCGEITKMLIAAGGNVNKQNRNNATPLHYAIMSDCAGTVQALIAAGANVNLPGDGGRTPLHIAVMSWHLENFNMVQALIAAGADLTIQNDEHETAFQACNHEGARELLNDYQRRIQQAQQRAPIIARTLAMATHERLGAESPLAVLDQNLLRHISQLTTQAELHAARQPRQ